jgi:DNA-binding NtrC family response regulator
MKHVLVVDDEVGTRESLKAILKPSYRVTAVSGAAEASEVLRSDVVDLLLLDVIMPGRGGLDLLKDVRELHPDMPVVMISAVASAKPVVAAMRAGAYDYVQKPFDCEDVVRVARRAIESVDLHRRVENLESELARRFPVAGIVGESPAIQATLECALKAAPTGATVLIQGESGTGKELLARFIHANSPRREAPFVAVHCAALTETLMESELFGHEKGAFTDAHQMKIGRFDLAASGTLFFDELSEMSLSTQVKLLRVLQEREFMRVGGTRTIRTDVRILAASARDLREEVKHGRFRDDLYYRISVVPVRLPPLRERVGDVHLLARHFLNELRTNLKAAAEGFAPEAMEAMRVYSWPGNIRELRNVVEHMLVLHGHHRLIPIEALPVEVRGAPPAPEKEESRNVTLQETLDARERQVIVEALARVGGVQTKAAELLGTTRRILSYRMGKLGIPCRQENRHDK